MDEKPSVPPSTPPLRPGEKVIQPLASSEVSPEQVPPKPAPVLIDTSIYPEVSADIGPGTDPAHAVALAEVSERTAQANRFISMRVKTVLVLGVLFAATGIYSLVVSMGASTQVAQNVGIVVSLIQIAMSLALLFSRDKHRVLLMLKIFLVLEIFSLFFSLSDFILLTLIGIIVILLFYAHARVKSLSIY